jgi:hypothetical protein
VPNRPNTRAALAVSLSRKLSTSLGRIGMIRPSANMSSNIVTKINATAAPLAGDAFNIVVGKGKTPAPEQDALGKGKSAS